jgi:hypothetical protein
MRVRGHSQCDFKRQDESIMIARHESSIEKLDIWARIAAPVAPETISWRQDGRSVMRDGKYVARFVAYIEANTVRERLDEVVPGEWDLTLELLPPMTTLDESSEPAACSFKARLQILGVIREDVGTGKDYKQAATDAFKRAAVRFGIGHELYAYEQNWVEVDGDGKYARPVEDPQAAYERRLANRSNGDAPRRTQIAVEGVPATASAVGTSPITEATPSCPVCGGRMWDNRATKRNPRAPDFKCRDRSCDGVVWPPKTAATAPEGNGRKPAAEPAPESAAFSDEIPF